MFIFTNVFWGSLSLRNKTPGGIFPKHSSCPETCLNLFLQLVDIQFCWNNMTSSRIFGFNCCLLAIQTLSNWRSSPCAEGCNEVNAEAGKAHKFQQNNVLLKLLQSGDSFDDLIYQWLWVQKNPGVVSPTLPPSGFLWDWIQERFDSGNMSINSPEIGIPVEMSCI